MPRASRKCGARSPASRRSRPSVRARPRSKETIDAEAHINRHGGVRQGRQDRRGDGRTEGAAPYVRPDHPPFDEISRPPCGQRQQGRRNIPTRGKATKSQRKELEETPKSANTQQPND